MSSPTKAIIPVAGRGTRLGPLASVVPKSMFPLIGSDGRLRPVLELIVGEAFSSGIAHVGVVVSSWQAPIVRGYFEQLDRQQDAFCHRGRITVIEQCSPDGLGGAVLACESFIGGEPFMVLLGDHVHTSDSGAQRCAAQVAGAFGRCECVAMTGMQAVSENELSTVGVGAGTLVGDRLYQCTALVEKPSVDVARSRLVTAGLPAKQYLAHSGIYMFGPEILDCLREVADDVECGCEIGLTRAQALLLERHRQEYFLFRVAGTAYDMGTVENYRQTLAAFWSDQSLPREPSGHG